MNDLYLQGLRIDWDTLSESSYVHNIPAIKSISEMSFRKGITFFVGENGSGKSTLLEAIAVEFGYNAEGGTKNYSFSTYYDVSPLNESITLIKGWQRPKFGYFFRAETFLMSQRHLCSNTMGTIITQTLMEKAIFSFWHTTSPVFI